MASHNLFDKFIKNFDEKKTTKKIPKDKLKQV